jgi:hypothetical protein
MVLLTTGISAASTIAAPDQTLSTQAETPSQQTSSPSAAPTPPPASADQLPAPRETIHFVRYEPLKSIEGMSSSYIPLDSWIYPAVMRLYGLGFVDTVFLGMRPWTRLSVAHMLDLSADRITGSTSDEAIDIYAAIEKELQPDMRIPLDQKFGRAGLDSVYERVMGIGGTPLRDSFHLGQTDINDFLRVFSRGNPARPVMGRLSAQPCRDFGQDRRFRHLQLRSLTRQYDHPSGPNFFCKQPHGP